MYKKVAIDAHVLNLRSGYIV